MERLQLRIKKEKEKRLQYAEELKQTNPGYFEIFKMISEIGPTPLNGEIDDLINLVLETQK